jgi:hypothetical protein
VLGIDLRSKEVEALHAGASSSTRRKSGPHKVCAKLAFAHQETWKVGTANHGV